MLNYISNTIQQNKPSNVEVFCDIAGKDINKGTIPPDILVTQSRPDLVLLNQTDKIICLLELTCSFERNAEAAYLRKSIRYTSLKNDLEDIGYKCFLVPFEVGSRGHIKKSTKSDIFSIFTTMKISANPTNVSKICQKSLYLRHLQFSMHTLNQHGGTRLS